MNWKPKKGVGKTLYAIDTWNYNFNSSTPYIACTSYIHYPTIVKYTDVIIIANGPTKRSTFIVAKKKGDTEYKTYKLKKINSINEDKQGVVLMRGQNIIISNDKKELLNIFSGLYKTKEIAARKAIDDYNKTKEIAARKAIDDYNAGVSNYYYTNLNWIGQKLMEQPKYVMASYKNFVEKLKKI